MNEQKLKNLTQLIDDASALSVAEKEEWKLLLPQMTDAQAGDLENILSNKKPANIAPGPSETGGRYSHLANMPHAGGPPVAAPASPVIPRTNTPITPPPVAKPKAPVAPQRARLDQKELPGTSILTEPEIEAAKPAAKAAPVEPVQVAKPQIPVVPPVPPVAAPAPVQAKPSISDVRPTPAPVSSAIKNFPKPFGGQPSAVQPVSIPRSNATTSTERLVRQTPFVVPTGAQGAMRAAEVDVPPQALSPAPSSGANPLAGRVTLNTLASLTVADFRSVDTGKFREAVEQLVRQNDYYQVKFAFERSPLHQIYVSMGRTVLEGKQDFATLLGQLQSQGRDYMTQVEFERFADFLTALQVN